MSGPCRTPVETPELWVDGNVEIRVLKVKADGPHSWKGCSCDGICRLHFEMVGFQELVQGLEVEDWTRSSGLFGNTNNPLKKTGAVNGWAQRPLGSRDLLLEDLHLCGIGGGHDHCSERGEGHGLSNSS